MTLPFIESCSSPASNLLPDWLILRDTHCLNPAIFRISSFDLKAVKSDTCCFMSVASTMATTSCRNFACTCPGQVVRSAHTVCTPMK